MTEKQITEAKRSLPKIFLDGGTPNPAYTDEVSKKWEELYCRDMINSILCYDEVCNMDNLYLKSYIETLGREKVKSLIVEQEKDFKEAVVQENVFTDGEGVVYNSIIWADEKEKQLKELL